MRNRELLETQHAPAPSRQLIDRGRPHAAGADDDMIEDSPAHGAIVRRSCCGRQAAPGARLAFGKGIDYCYRMQEYLGCSDMPADTNGKRR